MSASGASHSSTDDSENAVPVSGNTGGIDLSGNTPYVGGVAYRQ